MPQWFFDQDVDYPLQGYDGIPEYDLADDEKYNVQNEDEMPSISYSTHMSPHELTPLPATHELDY